MDTSHRSGAQGGCSLESLGPSRPQAQPACAGVRWAGIGAVAVRRDELDGTGAELTIPMTVPTSCRAYRADARSAGRDIYGNQDLHVPVLQRARDMQVFLYILRKLWRCERFTVCSVVIDRSMTGSLTGSSLTRQ